MNPEAFKNKLYIARDIEGNSNKEDLDLLRSLQEKMSEKKGFVGLAPFGSIVSGYSNEESDMDLYMLYDDPEGWGGKVGADLWKEIQNLTKEQRKKFDLLGHNINFDFLMHDIKNNVSSAQLATELGAMSRLVTGEKINAYREKFAAELRKLPVEQKTILCNNIVSSLFEKDIASLDKREERMPDLTEEEHQNILTTRKDMWEKRVKKVWNL